MKVIYDKKNKKFIIHGYTKSPLTHDDFKDMLDNGLIGQILDKEVSFVSHTIGTTSTVGKNLILTGAPGTGKSYKLNSETIEKNTIRCVFNADYTNTDFIGLYKPSAIGTGAKQTITYKFSPGPFIKALVKAFQNPDEMYWLVIEEINRADASSVFGEIFQLLDRDANGISEYTISVSDELNEYLDSQSVNLSNRLYIPNNLNIFATMNTSDQGVQTLDSAFKRRWSFESMPIDFSLCDYKDEVIYNGKTWEEFATALNKYMLDNHITEDRQLGQFFLKKSEVTDQDIFCDKLLNYLWYDIAKYNPATFFADGINSFEGLKYQFKSGANIFNTDLESSL